ncbi:MAG: hypothetical protein ABFC57_03250 [Veillonellales bacterium]
MTWNWPAVITGQPVEVTFVCQNCALMQGKKGYVIKKPLEKAVTITPAGRNVLERHYSTYNQALPYMDSQYHAVQERERNNSHI